MEWLLSVREHWAEAMNAVISALGSLLNDNKDRKGRN